MIVRDAQIAGSTATLRNDTAYTLRVAVSQLSGGAVSGSGITCAGCMTKTTPSPPAPVPDLEGGTPCSHLLHEIEIHSGFSGLVLVCCC